MVSRPSLRKYILAIWKDAKFLEKFFRLKINRQEQKNMELKQAEVSQVKNKKRTRQCVKADRKRE